MLEQYIFDSLVFTPVNKAFRLKLLTLARKFLLKYRDKPVVYKYKSYELLFPFSHDFPINYKRYRLYSQNLGLIGKSLAVKYPSLKAIDVGANIGDSVAIIQASVKAPVLCIEGNPRFLNLLQKNARQFHEVVLESCFVGEHEAKVKTVDHLGTAYLEESEAGFEVKTLSQVIEKYPYYQDAKLLKIDTDGYDNKIIRGAKPLLLKAKPAVFFEYDPYYLAKQQESGLDIFTFLKDLGYRKLFFYDNFGLFITSCTCEDMHLIKDLHQYFNRTGEMYMDVLALHRDDDDVLIEIASHNS